MLEADDKLFKSCCSTSTLLTLKPRQVLLAEQKQQQKSKRMAKKQEQQLNHRAALIHSILNYLQKNGFSKTFKRFLKEAQIEEDNWKTSLDLEDVYSRYLESSRDADKNSYVHKGQDVTLEKGSGDLSEEAISRKKKKKDKKGSEKDEGNGKGKSEETTKSKDKTEKHKLKTDSVVEDGKKTEKDSVAIDIPVEDCKTETNKRKKKKEVIVSKKSSDKGREMVDQGTLLETSEDGTKESKKRKLSASVESEKKNMEKSETRESKRRKTEDLDDAKVGIQQGKQNEQENGHVDHKEPQKLSDKEVDGSAKGDLMPNGIQKSAGQNSAQKQQNGSAEPKTAANAFQRVKVDEVKFTDERLQDNSYWAKGGAENGYGAKAQEILGQVKGRGFRHEKTKKKRGSYRGGQIDFQSHSIKFSYDDDEDE